MACAPRSTTKRASSRRSRPTSRSSSTRMTGHVAKEDVTHGIFKRVMNTGVAITGALITLLLSIIGYLLVNPVNLS